MLIADPVCRSNDGLHGSTVGRQSGKPAVPLPWSSGWTQASKARYLACALCGTQWNHVRIRCTACGSTEGISYYNIEGQPKTMGVETCTTCHSYIKHMQQHEDTAIDPVADDIASYALDLLAQEQDFRRSSLNPLFLMA